MKAGELWIKPLGSSNYKTLELVLCVAELGGDLGGGAITLTVLRVHSDPDESCDVYVAKFTTNAQYERNWRIRCGWTKVCA